MAFPLRSLAWAFVTIVSTAALLHSIARPESAAPILVIILFSLYVGLLCEAILDVTTRDDLRLRQRVAWLALCILVVPLVPLMAAFYFLLGRRRTALLLGGPAVPAVRPAEAGRVPHRLYSIRLRGRGPRDLRLRTSR